MPVTFESECGPKCRSKLHSLQVNAVITKGTLRDLQTYSRLCHTWAQHTDPAGRSALHLAAACGKTDIVDWLLKEVGQDVSQKDKESGWTPLHRASFYGQLTVARLLIQHNSNLYIRDYEGLGPLDLILKDQPKYLTFSFKEPNEVYSWGDNSNFTLGHANEQRRSIPEALDTFRRMSISVKQIVMCKYHSVFLTQTGQVFSCGHGQGGRLGHGDELTCVTPRLVEGLQHEICTQIAAGRDHTLFLTEKNSVFSCGLNSCSQLGQASAGDKVMDKSLVPVKVNTKILKGKNILGVCAGRFHTIVYTSESVYTCGLNAGQIGHPKGELMQSQLRPVSYLKNKDVAIACVATSDAAIVCLTTRGNIFLLQDYSCRKIASRWLEIKKLCISGGNLDHNTDLDVLREKGGAEVKVLLLSDSGKVFMWRSGSPIMKRCHWVIRRQILVTDVALNALNMLLVTDQGEAFIGYPSGKKSSGSSYRDLKDSKKDNENEFGKMSLIDLMIKDDVEEISLQRLSAVHRATYVTCDPKGRNCAVLQSLPTTCLTDVPFVSESTLHLDFLQLMEEADVCDVIHDTIVQVGEHKWPTHMYILASRSDYFLKQASCVLPAFKQSSHEERVVTVKDIQPEVMEQLLKFIYTDSCDVLTIGSKFTFSSLEEKAVNEHDEFDFIPCNGKAVSAFEVTRKSKERKTAKEEKYKTETGKDPVRVLQEAAHRFGVKGLAERLEGVKYVNGIVQLTGKKLLTPRIKFDKTKLSELCDVCIRADDDVMIPCHKCVLAARLEYFHNMLSCGWLEASDTKSLTLPVPGDILEILLDFVYLDDCPAVMKSQDLELLCNVLVMSDQLLIKRLKEMCEVALTSLITLRNVGELLEVSSAYNAGQLQLACQQFIVLNLPALLESRNLDMLSEETMQELTDYYRSKIPAMAYRIITPWSEGPDHEYLAVLRDEFSSTQANTVRDQGTKRSKHKRRQSRTKSSSEDGPVAAEDKNHDQSVQAARLISVSCNGSVKSEDDFEPDCDMPETRLTIVNHRTQKTAGTLFKENQPSSPTQILNSVVLTPTILKGKPLLLAAPQNPSASGKSVTLVDLLVTTGDTELTEINAGDADASGAQVLSHSSSNPSKAVSLRNIIEEEESFAQRYKPNKSGAGSTGAKFSWKELKKQQSRSTQMQKVNNPTVSRTAEMPSSSVPTTTFLPPACPWGSVNTVVPSFRDLMLKDKSYESTGAVPFQTPGTVSPYKSSTATKPQSSSSLQTSSQTGMGIAAPIAISSLSWGLPVRTPPQTAFTSPCPAPAISSLASSPPENPWQRFTASSPPGGAIAGVSFSELVRDELRQTQMRKKVDQKPLHLIQMEEQALNELLYYYHADEQYDEKITVDRASHTVAAPLWLRQKSST